MRGEFLLDPNSANDLVRLANCPVCGKRFVIPASSIYKLDTKSGRRYYCGYNCYRKVYKEMYEAKELKEKEKIRKELAGEVRL